METTTLIALAIFAITYGAILSEKVHKAVAAILGGCAMILVHIVSQEEAFAYVDLNVIFLLVGMMIIVHYLGESGFFGYVAVRLAQAARGRPVPLMVLLCLVTGALSALVDNVTTVLLIAPVTFLITEQLEVSPVPYLLFEVLASNVGGTATLIGDPPNILIGSAADLGFNAFIVHLTPVVIVCMAALVALAVIRVKGHAMVTRDVRARVMEMKASRAITSRRMLVRSGTVLAVVLVGFLLHEMLHVPPATFALAGAGILLVWTRADPEEAFKAVEWPTLFFFIGLFMTVSGLAATGVLEDAANLALRLTGNDLFITAAFFMWFAAVASAILGNVPVVTTLIPIVMSVVPVLQQNTDFGETAVRYALWWSLALGACLGGNGTVLGAAANIIVVDIARSNRQPISFLGFMKYGVPVTVVTLLIATVYVYLRYILLA